MVYWKPKDAEMFVIKPKKPIELRIVTDKLVIKNKELEITVDWQELKSFKRIVFVVGDEKLTFEKVKQNGEEKKV